MHLLIAPNAFKNALSATRAAKAIQKGLQLSNLHCTTTCFPIADGGDGTAALIVKTCKGEVVHQTVHDPLGRLIDSKFGLIDNGKTAVIEMADASGLRLLATDELDPITASSAGTGELIKAALDTGVNKIIIAMGGSATVDGGCGMLSTLGVRFLDESGATLLPQPKHLLNMASMDTAALDKRVFDCEIIVLCDVNNLLLGDEGAAAVFGPQKGASHDQVVELEKFLTLFNSLTVKQFDKEGPFGVAKQAKLKNLPVIGLAGSIPLDESTDLRQYFDILLAIGHGPTDLATAIKNTEINLTRTAMMIGLSLSYKPKP